MKRAIIPGSFDPVTLGHLGVFCRAAEIFDEVTVLVMTNSEKNPLFTADERCDMIKIATGCNANIKVRAFSGLTADYCSDNGINAIVKGVRGFSDFEYERQIAFVNKNLCGVDTFLVFAEPETQELSSTVIREMIKYGKLTDKMAPAGVAEYINNRQGRR